MTLARLGVLAGVVAIAWHTAPWGVAVLGALALWFGWPRR